MTPSSTRLTTAQREALRERLVHLAHTLADEIDAQLHSENLRHSDPGPIADVDADLGVAEAVRDTAELRQVEDALARVDSPSFGLCSDCGQPLAWSRLNALPQAGRCLKCESAHERTSSPPPSL